MTDSIDDLVLGGAGLIGTELCRQLRDRGHEVCSLDLKTGQDLREAFRFREHFEAAGRIWFLAWDVGGWKYLSRQDLQHKMYMHNCQLSISVFEELRRCGRPFLFVTSQMAGAPTAYGQTKQMAEHWAAELGGRLSRLWNVYGWQTPGEKSHLVTDVVAGALHGEIVLRSDGSECRQFIHIEDCAKGLISQFETDVSVADLASGEWVSVRSIAEIVANKLQVPLQCASRRGAERIIDPDRMLPHWTPMIGFGEGLDRVIQAARGYFAEHPSAMTTVAR